MDPSKSPSAPPPGWNPEDKSGMAYPAPPPYQEYPQYPNMGYPQSGQPVPGGYAPAQQYSGVPGPYPPSPSQYPQGAQPMVTVQPTVFVTQTALAQPYKDYLGYSIFTMLCCCLPLGIAALIYSISTRDANNQGQQQMAERCSVRARNLNHAALGIGIAVVILWIVYTTVISSSI